MSQNTSRRLLLLSMLLPAVASARGGRGSRGGRGGHGSGAGGLAGLVFLGIGGAIWFTWAKVTGRREAKRQAADAAAAQARAEAIERAKPPKDKWQELGLCPLCGSPMVQRVARVGRRKGKRFFGCSTYPKCVGTRDA